MTDTPGAGEELRPYRWRPMDFKVNGKTYTNERAVATQQTAWSFVAEVSFFLFFFFFFFFFFNSIPIQSRSEFPDIIGGIFWFGMDDTALNVYTPFYCGTTAVPQQFAVGNGDILTYSRMNNHSQTKQ